MGYIPDWQRQSHAKSGGQAKPTSNNNIQSRPIFHSEKAHDSNAKQTPFTRHYEDGSPGSVGSDTDKRNLFQKIGDSISKAASDGQKRIDEQAAADGYDKHDTGLLGGKIRYREDADGRKWVQKKDPISGRTEDQRYYSSDDVKSFFGGKKKSETLSEPTKSATDDLEKSANQGSPAKTAVQSANDSYTAPKPGVFSNVDAAVKSATKVGDDTGITSTTGPSTSTRSNSAVKKAAPKPVGRKDIPGSDAVSYPLDNDSLPSKPYPVKSSANEDRPEKSAPVTDHVKAAQDAGTRFVAMTNYVKNLPAGTSPSDRAKAGQLMRDAQTDYETKSARVRRS
jgi:hypothetical protein